MSLLRPLSRSLPLPSSSLRIRHASSLIYIEHKNGKLNESTLHAVTAAKQILNGGEDVLGAVVVGGEGEVGGVVEEVKKIEGINKIYTASSPKYTNALAENVTPLLSTFLTSNPTYTHLFAPHTALAKDLFPRLAGTLGVSMIADIIALSNTNTSSGGAGGETVFKRPIYAGNAILEVKTSGERDKVRIVSVRTTAFDKASVGAENGAEVVEMEGVESECELSVVIGTDVASLVVLRKGGAGEKGGGLGCEVRNMNGIGEREKRMKMKMKMKMKEEG